MTKLWLIMLLIILICMVIVYISWVKSDETVNKRFPIIIGLIVGLFAAGGYYWLGNPAALGPTETFTYTGDIEEFVNAVDALEQKAAKEPNNLEHQIMLAYSYRAMGRYEDSVAAFGKSWGKIKDNPHELALFAGTLAIWRGSFEGKPDELIEQALRIDAQNADALMLAGGSAYQRRQLDIAVKSWEKIDLKQLAEEDQVWVRTQIEEVKKEINGASTQEINAEQYEKQDQSKSFGHPPVSASQVTAH
ncbi:tetratricopeptide repeat protein [Neisseria iguanae]|uniref:Cytochrome C biogenesis protein n=1 Tax=Neisseria iguanae TaxID=90242 RepID=A0A2P7U0E5_9NEIS|nr:hypothetical protein [Neisseria iguanae]PSJ80439.1 hypothetical protein C7N83_06225 [Neisseria iguanae]